MDNIRKLVDEVLTRGTIMSLATVDDGGLWVSDLLYVHDKALNLYWISRTGTRHSKAIEKHPRVAASVTVNITKEPDAGVQIEGTAHKVTEGVDEIVKLYQKKLEREEGVLDSLHAWYRLTPTKIDLIYESLWGHEKKTLLL